MAVVSAPIRPTLLLYAGLGLASECIGLCTPKAELINNSYSMNWRWFPLYIFSLNSNPIGDENLNISGMSDVMK